MISQINAIRETLRTLENQVGQLHSVLRLVTQEDLAASEARIIAAIKNSGKPADMTKLVKAGDQLEAETKSLEAAIKNNTPPENK